MVRQVNQPSSATPLPSRSKRTWRSKRGLGALLVHLVDDPEELRVDFRKRFTDGLPFQLATADELPAEGVDVLDDVLRTPHHGNRHGRGLEHGAQVHALRFAVLGFGGLISSGDLFATIMFSKVPIPPDVADQFRVIGLNLKIAVLPFARKPLFRQ